MLDSKTYKLICSLPIIFIALYFIPFIGICLLLVRFIVYRKNKYYKTPLILIGGGLILILPKIIKYQSITKANIYNDIFRYGKLLLIVGFIVLIISWVVRYYYHRTMKRITNSFKVFMDPIDYDLKKDNKKLIKDKSTKKNKKE